MKTDQFVFINICNRISYKCSSNFVNNIRNCVNYTKSRFQKNFARTREQKRSQNRKRITFAICDRSPGIYNENRNRL